MGKRLNIRVKIDKFSVSNPLTFIAFVKLETCTFETVKNYWLPQPSNLKRKNGFAEYKNIFNDSILYVNMMPK